MHILHITPYYAPAYPFGGVVSAVEGMAKALHRRGHDITILTTDALNRNERYSGAIDEIRDGIRVVRVPNRSVFLRGNLNLSTPFGMRHIVRDLLPGVDAVHLHEFRTLENLLVLPEVSPELPVILSPHGTLTYATGRSRLKQLWDAWLSPRIARRINQVIGLTQQESSDAQALWQTFRIPMPASSVIPNGINPAEFASLPDPAVFREKYHLVNQRVVLFLGRLHARKGVEALVSAFKLAHLPATKLVLAGPDEGMRSVLTPLLDETMVLTGYLAGDERLQALASADIFALPASGEGLSMSALEAMGAGIPVILAPGCHLPEAGEAGAGLIVEPQPEALAQALTTLMQDEARRQKMGSAARNLILERFTWAKVSAQLEEIYQNLPHRELI